MKEISDGDTHWLARVARQAHAGPVLPPSTALGRRRRRESCVPPPFTSLPVQFNIHCRSRALTDVDERTNWQLRTILKNILQCQWVLYFSLVIRAF